MEMKSKSFGVIRSNRYGSKTYIRQKTVRAGKTFWQSILNIQGPNHKDVAPANSLICKKKISRGKLVDLKNQWLKDGVPEGCMGDKGIAEEEDDDRHQEEEEDRLYGDSE